MMCNHYCKHGGRCFLKNRHKGEHDSEFCTWKSKDSISKEEADEVMEIKFPNPLRWSNVK